MDFLDAIAGGNGQAEWSSRGFASTPADGDKEDLLGSGIELDEVAELLGISFDVSKHGWSTTSRSCSKSASSSPGTVLHPVASPATTPAF
jgi:hypothetical protein